MTLRDILKSEHVWVIPEDLWLPAQARVLGAFNGPTPTPLVRLGIGGDELAEVPACCYPTREHATSVALACCREFLAAAEGQVRKFRQAVTVLEREAVSSIPPRADGK
jgi:hypothetical protein